MPRTTRSQARADAAPPASPPATASAGKKRKTPWVPKPDEALGKRPKTQKAPSKTKKAAPPSSRPAAAGKVRKTPYVPKPDAILGSFSETPAPPSEPGNITRSVKELKALRDGPVPDTHNDTPPRYPANETKYWLLKSEPEVRMEDGYAIKFSIDDLAAKDTPEGWEGIRAYAARNNLRQMRKGDRAFFYHSNCKEPGVVGVMRIVKEFSPDWNACINDNPYYDAKAPHDGSRWSLVHVRLEHKFPQIVPLRTLKEIGPKGPLANMQLLKQSRLSVSSVSKTEWDEIMRLAKGLVDEEAWDASIEQSKLEPNYRAE